MDNFVFLLSSFMLLSLRYIVFYKYFNDIKYSEDVILDLSCILLEILNKIDFFEDGEFVTEKSIRFIVKRIEKGREIIKNYPYIFSQSVDGKILKDYDKRSSKFGELSYHIMNYQYNSEFADKVINYLNIFLSQNLSKLPQSEKAVIYFPLKPNKKIIFKKIAFILLILLLLFPIIWLLGIKFDDLLFLIKFFM